MRFIADQDVYIATIKELRKWGHEVATARELGMQQASDGELLNKASALSSILITRDKDFGALTFLKEKKSAGIVFLRCSPTNLEKVHEELKRLLLEHQEKELNGCFAVIEYNRYRIRRLAR
jgi:predicted nuclease of predicted toxin-antitoxin system